MHYATNRLDHDQVVNISALEVILSTVSAV